MCGGGVVYFNIDQDFLWFQSEKVNTRTAHLETGKTELITAANLEYLSLQNVTHYHDHHHIVEFRNKLTKVKFLNFKTAIFSKIFFRSDVDTEAESHCGCCLTTPHVKIT